VDTQWTDSDHEPVAIDNYQLEGVVQLMLRPINIELRIVALISATVGMVGCFNCPDWLEDEIKPDEYNGRVVLVAEGYPCQLDVTLDQDGHEKKISLCKCGLNSGPWQSIKTGDVLVKGKGSVSLTLTRGDTTIAVFDYPCCDH